MSAHHFLKVSCWKSLTFIVTTLYKIASHSSLKSSSGCLLHVIPDLWTIIKASEMKIYWLNYSYYVNPSINLLSQVGSGGEVGPAGKPLNTQIHSYWLFWLMLLRTIKIREMWLFLGVFFWLQQDETGAKILQTGVSMYGHFWGSFSCAAEFSVRIRKGRRMKNLESGRRIWVKDSKIVSGGFN